MDDDIRICVAESLLDVLGSGAIYVEGCDIFSILGLFGTFDACDIAQLAELFTIERLIPDLQWLILLPPFQRGCELLFGFLEVVDVGSKELLEDDEGRMRRWIAGRERVSRINHLIPKHLTHQLAPAVPLHTSHCSQ